MLTIESNILTIEPDVILFSFESIFQLSLFITSLSFSFSFSFSFSLFFYLFILTDGQDRLRVYDVERLFLIKQENK